MASIEKMQIRGIRSFSPLDDEIIEFYSPLTMIVGANGCGKTTIIESLKYACTGILPPGCKNGQNFVNDPTMTDSTDVKANIKMRFRSRAGVPSVVVRSLQLTKKRNNKLEFKALDGVVRTTNNAGEKTSSSAKCSELDRQVPEMMGVSSAIMENVIFCHQEESNWPMMEGAILKKKFDDVFESTRYAKALDAFSKTKKEYAEKAKSLKIEVVELAVHSSHAKDYQKELEACHISHESSGKEIADLEERLEICDERIKNARKEQGRFEDTLWKLQEFKRKISDLDIKIEEKSSRLETTYTEDDDSLRRKIDNFDAEMKGREEEKRTMQRNVDVLNREIGQLRDNLDDLNVRKGMSDSLESQRSDTLKQQLQQIKSSGSKHSMPPPSTADGFRDFTARLREKLDRLRSEYLATVSDCRKVVELREKNYMDTKGELQKQNFNFESKKKELDNVRMEIDKRRTELHAISDAKINMQQVERDYRDAQTQHDRFMETFPAKSTEFKQKIKEAVDEIREISEQYTKDAEILRDLSTNRSRIAELQAQEKQLESEKAQIELKAISLFETNRDILQNAPKPDNANALEPIIISINTLGAQKKNELIAAKEELMSSIQDVAATDALIAQKRNQVNQWNHQIEAMEVKIKSTLIESLPKCNDLKFIADDYEGSNYSPMTLSDDVNKMIETIDVVTDAFVEMRSMSACADRLQKDIIKIQEKRGNDACMCCGRDLTPDIMEQYEKNKEKIMLKKVQRLVKDHDAVDLISKSKAIKNKLLNAVTDTNSIEVLKQNKSRAEAEILELSTKKNKSETDTVTAKARINDLEISQVKYDKLSKDLTFFKISWQTHLGKYTEYGTNKTRHSQSIAHMDLGNRTFEEIEEEQRSRTQRKDEAQTKKDRFQTDEASLLKKQSLIKLQFVEKEREFGDAEKKLARHNEIDTSLRNLLQQAEELETAKETISTLRVNLERTLSEQENELNDAKAEQRQKTDASSSKVSFLREDVDNLERTNDLIDSITARCEANNSVECNQKLEDTQLLITKKEDEIKSLNPRISSIISDVNSRTKVKRIIEDNIDLRNSKKERNRLMDELSEFEKRTGGTEEQSTKCSREIQKQEQNKLKITSEKDRLLGNQEIFVRQASDLEARLNKPELKGIAERFRQKKIDFEVTNFAVADLATYYDALDLALQNFHSLKIREINKIIRELWQLIYKGQDIDMIELESGQDQSTTGRSSRSYNYRVVMKKGDTPLDMRGRCSAGQRVLASVVIRLALAETFCLNCGILALDEPTTNLDEANKSGLAHALARIIFNRKKQQNFQLICITHDEDFVRLMKNELSASADFSMPDNYIRVARELDEHTGKFFSKIQRVRWEDM